VVEEQLVQALGGGVTIGNLTRLSGGASRETWAFDAVHADGTVDELVLRRDPPGGPRAEGGMELEARLLRAAAAAGVPVPAVVATLPGGIVMERIAGETIPRRILRDEAARPRLAAQCGEILARLHRIDPEGIEHLPEEDPLVHCREVLDTVGEPHPAFELGLRWLARHRPPATRRALVHGDFRNGNLVVGPEGVRAVLDWELAHAGDPMEDLGWLCTRAWRFGSELPVGGFGDYDALIDAYQAAGGTPVDRAALRWWEVLGSLKWGVICIVQAQTHLSGAVRSVELAAIGRRVCENEWDVLDLIS
jgi:aminoglycoside phosphotransferase (APT) family kinase protein